MLWLTGLNHNMGREVGGSSPSVTSFFFDRQGVPMPGSPSYLVLPSTSYAIHGSLMAFNNEKTVWVDPDTGTAYDLEAFKSFVTTYEIKPNKQAEPFSVSVRIRFSNHAYSRTRKDEEANQVIDTQQRRDGTTEQRVFCQDRWAFCQGLTGVIENLGLHKCLEGGGQDIIYRQEQASQIAAHDGWYICMRLDYRENRKPAFELWIRSVHWRRNRPVDIRNHGGQKFRHLLSQFAKKKGVLRPP